MVNENKNDIRLIKSDSLVKQNVQAKTQPSSVKTATNLKLCKSEKKTLHSEDKNATSPQRKSNLTNKSGCHKE